MPEQPDILISVHRRFADGMIEGSKGVELRRRRPRIPAQTRIWIYEKAPVASVRALAILQEIHQLAPAELWARYGEQTALTFAEFENYASGARTLSALVLDHVHHLHRPVSLADLRLASTGFHPPQFFMKLPRSGAVSLILSQQIACGCGACSPRKAVTE